MSLFDSNLCWKQDFNPLNYCNLWEQLMLLLTRPGYAGAFALGD